MIWHLIYIILGYTFFTFLNFCYHSIVWDPKIPKLFLWKNEDCYPSVFILQSIWDFSLTWNFAMWQCINPVLIDSLRQATYNFHFQFVGIFCSNIAKFFLNNNQFDCNTLDLVLVWSLPPTCKNIIIFTYSVYVPELVTELHFFSFLLTETN